MGIDKHTRADATTRLFTKPNQLPWIDQYMKKPWIRYMYRVLCPAFVNKFCFLLGTIEMTDKPNIIPATYINSRLSINMGSKPPISEYEKRPLNQTLYSSPLNTAVAIKNAISTIMDRGLNLLIKTWKSMLFDKYPSKKNGRKTKSRDTLKMLPIGKKPIPTPEMTERGTNIGIFSIYGSKILQKNKQGKYHNIYRGTRIDPIISLELGKLCVNAMIVNNAWKMKYGIISLLNSFDTSLLGFEKYPEIKTNIGI